MEMVKLEIEVPKEANEVADALVLLVEAIKAKKEIAVIVAEVLPKLMVAVDGFSELDDEAKSPEMKMLLGILVGKLAKALLV